MPKRFRCAADEKLFTVAADFNRLRDPRDPFLLCASNPLGGRALWVAPSVASTYGGQRRAAPPRRNVGVERSEKRARPAPPPHSLAVTFRRKVRGWPGERLLLPSAEAQ